MQWLEYFGVISGLLYLFLEIKQHKSMWVVGFLTSLVYVFVFLNAKIYADMGLQAYYVAISVYGFFQWTRQLHSDNKGNSGQTDEQILYTHLTPALTFVTISSLSILFIGIWYFLSHFTDSPIPIGDAFTTAVGIVATWMLARRIIEHWIFWVIINFISVYLYYLRGLYPTMLLYVFYALLAIAGYYNWKKKGTLF